jgi:hypothetical protein
MRSGDTKLRNRLIFKLTGRWPHSVVRERLAEHDAMPAPDTVQAILRDARAIASRTTQKPGSLQEGCNE